MEKTTSKVVTKPMFIGNPPVKKDKPKTVVVPVKTEKPKVVKTTTDVSNEYKKWLQGSDDKSAPAPKPAKAKIDPPYHKIAPSGTPIALILDHHASPPANKVKPENLSDYQKWL